MSNETKEQEQHGVVNPQSSVDIANDTIGDTASDHKAESRPDPPPSGSDTHASPGEDADVYKNKNNDDDNNNNDDGAEADKNNIDENDGADDKSDNGGKPAGSRSPHCDSDSDQSDDSDVILRGNNTAIPKPKRNTHNNDPNNHGHNHGGNDPHHPRSRSSSKSRLRSSIEPIPETMRSAELVSFRQFGSEFERPIFQCNPSADVPEPRSGEVLVKVHYAAVNPHDLEYTTGEFMGTKRPKVPVVPGFECSGTVVASGGGLMAWNLLGKNVCVWVKIGGRDGVDSGTYAQYVVANVSDVFSIKPGLSLLQAALSISLPFCAMGLLERIKSGRHTAVVQTGAASQVGRMVLRLCMKEQIPVLSVLTRTDQLPVVERYYHDTEPDVAVADPTENSMENFAATVKAFCAEHSADCLLDCVGGALTQQVLKVMPRGTTCIVYGSLAGPLHGLDADELVHNAKTMEGFCAREWFKSKGTVNSVLVPRRAQEYFLNKTLRVDVAATYPLEEINEAFQHYLGFMSDGKILLCPNGEDGNDMGVVSGNEEEAGAPAASPTVAVNEDFSPSLDPDGPDLLDGDDDDDELILAEEDIPVPVPLIIDGKINIDLGGEVEDDEDVGENRKSLERATDAEKSDPARLLDRTDSDDEYDSSEGED